MWIINIEGMVGCCSISTMCEANVDLSKLYLTDGLVWVRKEMQPMAKMSQARTLLAVASDA